MTVLNVIRRPVTAIVQGRGLKGYKGDKGDKGDPAPNTIFQYSVNGTDWTTVATGAHWYRQSGDNGVTWSEAIKLAITDYVDGKISQTITEGVEDKAPSEAAVFDALALKIDSSDVAVTAGANKIPKADANGDIDSGWIKDASATVKGVVELATDAEVIQGTDTERAITPAGLLAGFPTRLRSNLLGTVSQSGGIPTGAVIESGSNANGRYVKFANGTMVCWATGLSVSELTINVMTNVKYTFPAAFLGSPSTSVGIYMGYVVAGSVTTKNGGGTNTQCSFHIISTSSSFLTFSNVLDYHAIGRWF